MAPSSRRRREKLQMESEALKGLFLARKEPRERMEVEAMNNRSREGPL